MIGDGDTSAFISMRTGENRKLRLLATECGSYFALPQEYPPLSNHFP